jgi:hypothetical protein
MTVSPAIAAVLLAYAAATDNRIITEEAARAWADVLDDHVTPADGKAAIIAHRRTSTDYLMPIHVNAGVRAIRRGRTERIGTEEVPPAELAENPARALAWSREYRRAIGDGEEHASAERRACESVGVAVPLAIEGTHRMPDVAHLARRVPEGWALNADGGLTSTAIQGGAR